MYRISHRTIGKSRVVLLFNYFEEISNEIGVVTYRNYVCMNKYGFQQILRCA